jgi:hypothetical protein
MCDECCLKNINFNTDLKVSEETDWKKYYTRRRAGVIIVNYHTNKILVVQSYHKHWGLPKGHLERNETLEDCAIREAFEETGIRISKDKLGKQYSLYRGDCVYFLVDGSDCEYDITHIMNKDEITGIGWTCIECLKKWKNESEEFLINNHLRVLLNIINQELTSDFISLDH